MGAGLSIQDPRSKSSLGERRCMVYITLGLYRYYGEVFPAAGKKDAAILDLCSSWISHYPKGYTAGRIAGDHQTPGPTKFSLPVDV